MVNAVQLFHQLKHYEDQELVEKFWQFSTKTIAEFPSKEKSQCQQPIVPFLLHCPEILAEIILAKKAFCQQNSAQFVHSIVERGKEEGKLRRALLGNEALLKMVEDELLKLPVESNQPDAAFGLNLLEFLATLVDKESVAKDMQPHLLPIFASIRSLWTSNSFQQRHSVRNILPPSEQIATEESIKT